MQKSLRLVALVGCVLSADGYARTVKNSAPGQDYQTATVVSVEKHETPSNYVGDNPSDRPLQARSFAYEVGIRMDCNVYGGLYQSAIHYLPIYFAPDQSVDVRLRKHVMYVSLPYHAWDVELGIVRRRRIKSGSCAGVS